MAYILAPVPHALDHAAEEADLLWASYSPKAAIPGSPTLAARASPPPSSRAPPP